MGTSYSINGHGTFAIKKVGGDWLYFLNSKCQDAYPQEVETDRDLDETIIDDFDGYRAELDVTIFSTDEYSYKDLFTLIDILETRHFDIRPFANEGENINHVLIYTIADYDMMEVSDWSPRQLHRCFEKGQDIKLSFQARKLVQTRPTEHSNTDAWSEIVLGSAAVQYNVTGTPPI
jgi:hypothetical protein